MMQPFLHWVAMGGYASYVWPAYGLMGVMFVMNGWHVRKVGRRIRQKIQHHAFRQ